MPNNFLSKAITHLVITEYVETMSTYKEGQTEVDYLYMMLYAMSSR